VLRSAGIIFVSQTHTGATRLAVGCLLLLPAADASEPHSDPTLKRRRQSVLFQIKDVETAPGCHMLPIIAQRADTDTGETKDRNTPFFANYRPQFYLR
jgi:hypothetical protein